MSKKSRPKSVDQYLKAARENKRIVPSLKKYSRRKKLNRWEKAAITRATNKISEWGGATAITPLSKRQIKRLRNKNVVIGEGIQGIHVTNVGNKVRIDKRGDLHIEQITERGVRKHHTIGLGLDLQEYLSTIEDLLNRTPRGKRRYVFVWTVKGRGTPGFEKMGGPKGAIAVLTNKYFSAYSEIEKWMLGLVYYDEEI